MTDESSVSPLIPDPPNGSDGEQVRPDSKADAAKEPEPSFVVPPDEAADLVDVGQAAVLSSEFPDEELVPESALVAALSTRVGSSINLGPPEARAPSPAGSALPQVGEVIAGKYKLEALIARGGMGQIYVATQQPLGRRVAVKVVTQQTGDVAFRQRFLLEASTCAKLSHPNVVVVHDYGETQSGHLFTVMEYLGRRSLARLLRREGRLDAGRVCTIGIQVARALRAAHRAGIVHRDLKPSNVMLVRNREEEGESFGVKVVDFGLAKAFAGGNSDDQLTQAGMLLGSPRYMSPEQIRNGPVDPRSDVYSFGVILFQALAGRPPFIGDHASEILAQQLRDPPPPLSGFDPDGAIPKRMVELVERCLAKRPSERPRSMTEVLEELRAISMALGDGPSGASLLARDVTAVRSPLESSVSMVGPPDASYTFHPSQSMMMPSSQSSPWWAAVILLAAAVGSLGFWAWVLSS